MSLGLQKEHQRINQAAAIVAEAAKSVRETAAGMRMAAEHYASFFSTPMEQVDHALRQNGDKVEVVITRRRVWWDEQEGRLITEWNTEVVASRNMSDMEGAA